MWAALLLAMEAEQSGPLDEFDDAANGDPDSTLGEEDESGFDEMPAALGWPDETPSDDGFDDAGEQDEDEDEDGLEDEDGVEEGGEE